MSPSGGHGSASVLKAQGTSSPGSFRSWAHQHVVTALVAFVAFRAVPSWASTTTVSKPECQAASVCVSATVLHVVRVQSDVFELFFPAVAEPRREQATHSSSTKICLSPLNLGTYHVPEVP